MGTRTDLYRKPGRELVDEIVELLEQRDDLLAACKAQAAIVTELEIDCDPEGELWPEVKLMRDAIARVEGHDDA